MAEMRKPLRVLIIEDSEDDALLLVRSLKQGSYEPLFRRVDTPQAMKRALSNGPWDVIISDYIMPSFSATAALKLLKQKGLDLPFIIVSGKIGDETAVEAMKGGAHDYLRKDQLGRLVSVIERELREAEIRMRHRRAEEALQESRQQYQDLVESVEAVVWEADPETFAFTFVSHQVTRFLGYPAERWTCEPTFWKDHIHPEDRERVLQHAAQAISERRNFELEYRMITADGGSVWLRNLITVVMQQGRPVKLRGIMLDITERKAQAIVLEYQATHDALTNLPNRTLLYDRLEQAILAARRESRPAALLLMDLDRFKEINDTMGHQTGDVLLQQIGWRIRKVLRESDTAARLGGDEFAVILPNTDVEGAVQAVQKIQRALDQPYVVDDISVEIGVSIGISFFPEHGTDVDMLLRCADVAMYNAKQSGSGHTIYAPEQDRYSLQRLALMGELRQAIQYGQLFLVYQPKINLKTGMVTGVEALARWQHPQQGLIPPDQFIPVAERTGLIKPLTQWVLNEAVRQCKSWHQAGLKMTVAVNLSVRNLQDGQLSDQVNEPLQRYELSADFLELEITESILMVDPMRVMENLNALNELGARLSIDDFGTGYSSLGHLKKLPVDEIKVDRSFVKGMTVNNDDAVIVRSTIDMAHNLGLKVVAEGVENRETWNQLAALGCDSAQGYYMSRPIPADQFTNWLKESPWKIADA